MNVDAFHKRLKELYQPPKNRFTMVDVPEIRFAVIDGKGDPKGDDYAEAVKWLYSLVHLVKPQVKERMGKNFVEPPLECLFWADKEKDSLRKKKNKLNWRLMVVFVDWITQKQFRDAVAKAEKKLGPAPKTLRLETIHEGKCVQIMHVGDPGEIASVCDKLYHEFLPEQNLAPTGYHHEIYLNDPARTAPDKLRTVIRQAVK